MAWSARDDGTERTERGRVWKIVVFVVDGIDNHCGLDIPGMGLADCSLAGARIIDWEHRSFPKGERKSFEITVPNPEAGIAVALRPGMLTYEITANQNDYTATDGSNTCSTKTSLRISTNASRNITGLSCGQAEGDIRIIHNVGSFPAVLTNQDTLSTTTNRFLFGGDMTLAADTSVTIKYDGVASRWRAITSPGAGGGGGGVTSVGIVGAGLTANSGTCTITTSGTCTLTTLAASQSDKEIGTSNTVAVTPGTQKHHPTATKASAMVTVSAGVGTVTNGNNVSGTVTKNSTGDFTVTFTTSFSTTPNCIWGVGPTNNSGNNAMTVVNFSTGVSTSRGRFLLSGSLTDPDAFGIMCTGDF